MILTWKAAGITGPMLVGVALCAALAAGCGENTQPGVDDGGGTFGEPIPVAPADFEKWVWVPVPEMRCADDSEGGFAVNFTHQSRDLVVYLLGGGICYDVLTCTIYQSVLHGLGDDPLAFMFGADHSGEHTGIFDRADPENPLRQSNFVVLPHCTGDFHSGNTVATYPPLDPVHHVGYANVAAAIQRIVPTFHDAQRIVLAGYSAGGVGVTTNYHQFATAFASIGKPPPILIDDAGPTLRQPYLSQHAQDAIRASWHLDETVGAWCPACGTEGLHAVHHTLAQLHPGMRSSVVCAYSDAVVTALYTLLNGGSVQLKAGLLDFADWTDSYQDSVAPSAEREFYYAGGRHGATVIAPLSDTPGLAAFLSAQLDGSSTWTTVRP